MSTHSSAVLSAPAFLAGGGEIGDRLRAQEWTRSCLGRAEDWPPTLRVAVSIMLNSHHPMFLLWGAERVFFYNDACIPIVGANHPPALGKPLTQLGSRNASSLWPLINRTLNGESIWADNFSLQTRRYGWPEESWFTLSGSPLRDEDGKVVGALCTCMETTASIVANRRLKLQLRVGERLSQLSEVDDIRRVAAAELGRTLNAARVGYAFPAPEAALQSSCEWRSADDGHPRANALDWQIFGSYFVTDLQAGTALRVHDWRTDLRTPAGIKTFAAVGVMLVPIMQQSRLHTVLYVCADRPRYWSDVELELAQDVASRTRLAAQRARAVQASRAAEDALKQQLLAETNRLRELFALAPSFMAVLRGPEHVFELTNAALTRLVGRTDLIGKPIREALPDIKGQQLLELLDEAYATGEPRVGEEWSLSVTRPVPEVRFISFVYQPLFAADGAVQGVFVTGQDVTENRRTHEALRENEARLRLALRAARMGEMHIRQADSKVTHSPSCAEMFGYSADEPLTVEHLRARYHPDDAQAISRLREELWASGNNFISMTHRVLWPDGSTHWLSVRGEIERADDGQPLSVTAVYMDVTEQQRAVQALQQSEAQFRIFAQAVPNHVWFTDAAGHAEWVNDRFYEYAGDIPTHALDEGWIELAHPEDRPQASERWIAALTHGTPYEAELRFRNRHGEYRWFIARAVPIRDSDGKITRWIGSSTDIQAQKTITAELAALNAKLETRVEERSRELRVAEQALRHAQKMEAVGQLTGGIAHDFNNLLTGIIGGLEIVQRRMASGRTADAERFILAALGSANRAAALTQRLLAFSRQQQLDAKPLQLNDLVSSMAELLHRTLAENITLEVQLEPQLWLVEADRNQLESALLNLAINARDAMPEGGRVTVSTRSLHLDAQEAVHFPELEPGDYVVLCVSDTGTGMAPEVLERAFDPFFTTKPVGQGTGLGLSMIYGFARQSRGHVRLESVLGHGTAVTLYLPRYKGELPQIEAPPLAEMPVARAGESVLIVEDDAAVRMLVVDVLEELGYRFIEAADGTSAVPILQSQEKLDLLITDVGLPGMNGRDLAQLARTSRPDLKVLFITGYADDSVGPQSLLTPGMELVRKPFALEALARKIRQMLQQGS